MTMNDKHLCDKWNDEKKRKFSVDLGWIADEFHINKITINITPNINYAETNAIQETMTR